MRHTRRPCGRLWILVAVLLALLLVGLGPAGAAEKKKKKEGEKEYAPHITYLFPAGGQRGTTQETMIRGRGLDEAGEVRVSGKGVTAKVLAIEEPDTKLQQRSKDRLDTSDNPNIVRLAVTIAPDAVLGERDLRLVTPKGVTNRFRFFIGQVPEVNEVEPNSEIGQAQSLPSLPVLVNGQIDQADRDIFRFAAKAGQTLVCEVHARKILPFLADGVPAWLQSSLTLYDAGGKELAYVDDYRFDPDPLLVYHVAKDGEYLIEIKDVLYRGREDLVYRLSIGALPYLTHVFPLGGARSTTAQIELHGFNLAQDKLSLALPGDSPMLRFVQVSNGPLTSNALPLAVGDLPELTETEPNDSLEQANKVVPPLTINGRIGQSGDSDYYVFSVEAKQTLVMDLRARRLESPMDSLLTLMTAKGVMLVENDDTIDKSEGLTTHHADSRLVHTFATAGDYLLRVRDVQGMGGNQYAYRLTISPPRHDFTLRVTPDNPILPQGGTAVLTVDALRQDDFKGEIRLSLPDLPAGLVTRGAMLPEGQDQARLTITAPADAPASVLAPTIVGAAKIGDQERVRKAVPSEHLMQAFIYWHDVPTRDFLLAVTPPRAVALSVDLPPEQVVEIPQGGSAQVTVKSVRSEEAKGPIRLAADLPPKGVTVRVAPIPADKNEVAIGITALQATPVGSTQTVILSGNLKVGTESVTAFAPAILIKVVAAKPADKPEPTPEKKK